MTASEKQNIFNLLKTADSWASGYENPDFKAEDFIFEDDIEAAPQDKAATTGTANPDAGPRESVIMENQENQQPQSEKKGITLESLEDKLKVCHNCVLNQTRHNPVLGQGAASPYVLVVGENPGEAEDLTGDAFTGKVGQLLDKMLGAIGLDRECNCYLTTIVKCLPPMNRTPMADEASACSGYLNAQIHILKPKFILAMGRTAAQFLLQTDKSLNSLRGKFYEYNGIPLLATYNPEDVYKDINLKPAAWNDLKMFRAKLSETCPDYDQSFKLKNSR